MDDPAGSATARYDSVAIALHWLSAIGVLALLAMGLIMTDLKPGSALQFQLYQWHKSVGITVAALTLLRILWRALHRPPALPQTMPRWEQGAAHLGHLGLYALLVAMPLSGWAVVSTSPFNLPTLLYGVVPFPHMPILSTLPDRRPINELVKELHESGAWLLIVLLLGHVGAALRHHLLLRDDVLRRMTPRFPWGNHRD